jgi:flagellar motor protein MotB
MQTKLYTKLPTYKPSDKVWQNIEKELDTLQNSPKSTSYNYVWALVACLLLAFFVVLSQMNTGNIQIKANQNTQFVYTEEVLDTILVQNSKILASNTDAEIENLCEVQPVKCEDEYAKSLLKQIKDLSEASSELDQTTAEQAIPDMSIQKQKAHLEKEKHKRIKKLKRYLNE